jgi:hypothetical protein
MTTRWWMLTAGALFSRLTVGCAGDPGAPEGDGAADGAEDVGEADAPEDAE